MVTPSQDSFEESLVDVNEYDSKSNDEFESSLIDAEQYKEATSKEPSWGETIADYFVQAGRGALRFFTWPADVLKAVMLGEGLSDIDEVESAFEKAGKPFNRDEYVKSVFEQSRFVPTQDLLEKGIESVTGYSLEPKTKTGELIKRGTEVASFTPGGVVKKAASAATGLGTSEVLKQLGVSKGAAESVGDLGIVPFAAAKEGIKKFGQKTSELASTADKYGLPFLKFMAQEKDPLLKGKLFESAQRKLKDSFNWSAAEAINKVIRDNSLVKRLKDRGVNLESLADYAYDTVRNLSKSNPQTFNMQEAVKNIDAKIKDIKKMSPSPSDAQKAMIDILEKERDLLAASTPTSEQLVNQHINYNSNVKGIYRKPEFSGKEEEVRKAYAFLNGELVSVMEKQGASDVSNAFRAANKIYAEKQALQSSEEILSSFLNGETYDPKKLSNLLKGRKGKFLRRNLGDKAVKEIESISKYGVEAQSRMERFLDNAKGPVVNEVRSWGRLAPFLFTPYGLQAAGVAVGGPLARIIQGKLLVRPATRKAYKMSMKHAADGAFNLLKKDFIDLNSAIDQEYGSVDNFIDNSMKEIEYFD